MTDVKLDHPGGQFSMPVREAVEGPGGIDVSALPNETGFVTLDPEQVEISAIRLMAKLPTIAAYAYKKSIGHPLPYPDNSLDYVENFLRMTFGLPTVQYDVDPKIAKILDMLFILHADHEQNC